MRNVALSFDGESWTCRESGSSLGIHLPTEYALDLMRKFIGNRQVVFVKKHESLDALDKALSDFQRLSTVVAALDLAGEAMNCENPSCGRLIEPTNGDGPHLCPQCADERSGLK